MKIIPEKLTREERHVEKHPEEHELFTEASNTCFASEELLDWKGFLTTGVTNVT